MISHTANKTADTLEMVVHTYIIHLTTPALWSLPAPLDCVPHSMSNTTKPELAPNYKRPDVSSSNTMPMTS